MALKIKKGAIIDAYGPGSNPFTHETEVSQPILAHLKSRFPNDIEGELDAKDKEHEVKKPAPGKVVTPAGKDYNAMTVPELNKLAEGKEGFVAKMKKDALVALLTAADAAVPAPPAVDPLA